VVDPFDTAARPAETAQRVGILAHARRDEPRAAHLLAEKRLRAMNVATRVSRHAERASREPRDEVGDRGREVRPGAVHLIDVLALDDVGDACGGGQIADVARQRVRAAARCPQDARDFGYEHVRLAHEPFEQRRPRSRVTSGCPSRA
jgi:hypothetical protein